MLNHKGTVKIKTERLLLRKFSSADTKQMYLNWACSTYVTRYLSWQAHRSMDETRDILSLWTGEYSNSNYYNWAIELQKSKELMGSVGCVGSIDEKSIAALGFCLGEKFWNRGYMSEAVSELIRFLIFEVGYNRVQAVHHIDNQASGRVMEKAGMKFEGVLRQSELNNRGELVDVRMYAILMSDLK